MFLGTKNKVYILDKSENNPTTIDGKYGTHPAWAAEYDIKTQQGECITLPCAPHQAIHVLVLRLVNDAGEWNGAGEW